MKKIAFAFAIVLLLFISCNKTESINVINIAVSQEPPTLDVMANTSLISRVIAVGNIYEKLLIMDGDGNIQRELAESCFLSDDSHTLTFILRENIMFHDGSALDNEDAMLSMNRWLDMYKAASDLALGARFYLIDGGIEISSASSLAFLPVLIASSPQGAVIMPSEILEKVGNGDLVTEFIGTGPYMIKEWKSGERIELGSFDGYSPYGDKGRGIADCLIYYFVPDSVTRSLGMLSGTYDFANDVMSEDRALYDKPNSHVEVLEGSESGSIGIIFNKKEGIGTDIAFRKAVSLALDREKLMKACYGEYGWSVHSDYMEKEQIFSVPDENPYNGPDRMLAGKYIDESSYDGRKIRILTSNNSNMDKLAISLADDLSAIGIECELVILDWASMMARRSDSSCWDILISAYSTVPLPQMKLYLSPSYPGWIDEDEEGLMVMAEMNEAGPDEGASLWRKAQRALWESVPVIIPGHYTTAYAKRIELSGVIINNGFYFWNAVKKEEL